MSFITNIQLVHSKFIKVVLTDTQPSRKLISEQAAAAASEGKKQKKVYVKPRLKRRKSVGLYGTLLAGLLEKEYKYNL